MNFLQFVLNKTVNIRIEKVNNRLIQREYVSCSRAAYPLGSTALAGGGICIRKVWPDIPVPQVSKYTPMLNNVGGVEWSSQ